MPETPNRFGVRNFGGQNNSDYAQAYFGFNGQVGLPSESDSKISTKFKN